MKENVFTRQEGCFYALPDNGLEWKVYSVEQKRRTRQSQWVGRMRGSPKMDLFLRSQLSFESCLCQQCKQQL